MGSLERENEIFTFSPSPYPPPGLLTSNRSSTSLCEALSMFLVSCSMCFFFFVFLAKRIALSVSPHNDTLTTAPQYLIRSCDFTFQSQILSFLDYQTCIMPLITECSLRIHCGTPFILILGVSVRQLIYSHPSAGCYPVLHKCYKGWQVCL